MAMIMDNDSTDDPEMVTVKERDIKGGPGKAEDYEVTNSGGFSTG